MLNAAEVQSWSWRFIRVVIAVFVGVVCFAVALSYIARATVRMPVMPVDDAIIKRLNALPHVANATTDVRLRINEGRVSGEIAATLPRQHVAAVQKAIADVRGRIDWRVIVAAYVPTVDLGTRVLSMSSVAFVAEERNANGVIRVSLRDAELPSRQERFDFVVDDGLNIEHNTVDLHVITTGVQVIATRTAAARQSESETRFVSDRPIEFVVLRQLERSQSVRVSEIVSRFDYQHVRVIEPLIVAIMFSIPFVLLITLLRRLQEEERDHAPELRFTTDLHKKLAVAFIALFVGIGLARAAQDLYPLAYQGLHEAILDQCLYVIFTSNGAVSLGAAFVVCYWPSFARRARKGELAASSAGRRGGLWVLLLLSAAVAMAAAIATCSGMEPLHTLAIGAGLTAAVLGFAAASAEMNGSGRALLDGIILTAFGVAAELIDALVFRWQISGSAAFAATVLLFIPFLFALLRILIPKWSGSTLFAAALFGAVIIVGPMPGYRPWWRAELTTIVNELSPVLRLVVAVFLLKLLRHLSKTGHWAILERGERDAGIVLALTFFFLPSHQWLAILVTFSLGWLLLAKWVFVPRNIAASGDADAPATIRDLIRCNEASSALRQMKKGLREKVAKAEMPFHDYERHVRSLEAFVDDLRARVQPTGNKTPAAVLSSGNPMEPWARGAMGAKYGVLFAIPWIALYLADFHTRFAPDRGYAWVAALGSAVQTMGQWPLLGFFLGYFYPHLRGETGLSKGLHLFLTLIAPAFAAIALAMPTNMPAWTSFAYWALQLFIHCMLLGFIAGDYETLRASGLGWRQLVDVHNLGALTAWGSSLLIAIGAAATTATATEAGKLLTRVAQAIFPFLRN